MKLRNGVIGAAVLALVFTAAPTAGATPPPPEGGDDRLTATALTRLNRLVEVDVTGGRVLGTRQLTGVRLLETVHGIDYRPATGELYALVGGPRGARVATVTDGRVSAGVPLVDAAGAPIRLSGTSFGVDFNPVADRLRVTSDRGQNLRIDVTTGATTVDGALAYLPGDAQAGRSPRVVASAYTNGDLSPAGATALYDLDARSDSLVLQSPPNDGSLSTVARLTGLDVTTVAGFDITSATDIGVVVTGGALSSRVQVIDPTTGALLQSRSLPLTWVTDVALPIGQ